MQNITINRIATFESTKPSPFTDAPAIIIRKGDPIAEYRRPDGSDGTYYAIDSNAALFVQATIVNVSESGKITVVPSEQENDVVALGAGDLQNGRYIIADVPSSRVDFSNVGSIISLNGVQFVVRDCPDHDTLVRFYKSSNRVASA